MSHEQPLDHPATDRDAAMTEADVTSQTRFGPRPPPSGHHPARGPRDYRRVPPHGDVSPDGRHAYPRPSPLAKWIVWGGTGLAAAAVTAGTVIAARKVADMISGHDEPRRDRDRDRDDRRDPDQAPAPRLHLSAPPEPTERDEPTPRNSQRRLGLMEEIEANTATLSNSVDNVMHSVTAALLGFRGVAGQANDILREFGDAADMLRAILGRQADHSAPPKAARTGKDQDTPSDGDPRSHNL